MSETEMPDEPSENAGPDAAVAEAVAMDEAPPEAAEPGPASGALDGGLGDAKPTRAPAFMGVPIEVLISVGKARPLVSDLVKLRRDSVISLDSRIDDPVEIYVGDRLIARGELQEMEDSDGQLGVRLTEVADLSNGV